MRDWNAYVKERLKLPDLTHAEAARIVRELAAQLEDFNRDALAAGLRDADARAQPGCGLAPDGARRHPGRAAAGLTPRAAICRASTTSPSTWECWPSPRRCPC
jgi:hypothetical protein